MRGLMVSRSRRSGVTRLTAEDVQTFNVQRSKVNLWLIQPSRSDRAEARPNTQSDTKAEEGYIDTVYGRR